MTILKIILAGERGLLSLKQWQVVIVVLDFNSVCHNMYTTATCWYQVCWNRSLKPTLCTHCGLVTPYSDMSIGQHWHRLWFDAVRQQAITWAKVDYSSSAILAVQFQRIFKAITWETCSRKIYFQDFIKSCREQWVKRRWEEEGLSEHVCIPLVI